MNRRGFLQAALATFALSTGLGRTQASLVSQDDFICYGTVTGRWYSNCLVQAQNVHVVDVQAEIQNLWEAQVHELIAQQEERDRNG